MGATVEQVEIESVIYFHHINDYQVNARCHSGIEKSVFIPSATVEINWTYK